MKEKLKESKGITLIALVITIIVLLILAGVTIAMLTGENGILTQAKSAKTTTEIAEIKERVGTDVLGWQAGNNGEKINNTELKTILEKYFNEVPEDYDKDTEITAKNEYGGQVMKVSDIYQGEIKGIKSKISKDTSYVGCYADLDPTDGKIDGIIYADLAVGNQGSGQWGNSNGKYTIPTVTEGLKDYYISPTAYKANDGFGEKAVISPTGTGGEKDRFYIMALEDFNKGTYYDWYNAAYGNIDSSITKTEFGTGKANTTTMIAKWNAIAYGDQDKCSKHKDMWGQIQTEVNDGWFVPSKEEWAAFAGELGITSDKYEKFGLSYYYWSSSQGITYNALIAYFNGGYITNFYVNNKDYVRLGATF